MWNVSHSSALGAAISVPCRYPEEADGEGGVGTGIFERLSWPLVGTKELIVVDK